MFQKEDDIYPGVEVELLINCVKAYWHKNESTEISIRDILKRDVNWKDFLSLTVRNRVIPLVYRCLKNISPTQIPASVLEDLRKAFFEIAAYNVSQLNLLKKLLVTFHNSDIDIIPYKGPVIASFYSSFSLREWTDIDIIVRKRDVLAVQRLLFQLGYRCAVQPGNHQLNEHMSWSHSYSYENTQDSTVIDVHWSLTDVKEEVVFENDTIWKHCVLQNFFNLQTLMLGPEHLVLSTCIHHGVRNGWSELRYIADFAVILTTHKELPWKSIVHSAEKMRINKVLMIGVLLAKELLDIPLAPALAAILAPNKSLKKFRPEFLSRIANQSTSINSHFHHAAKHIEMRENFFIRLRLYRHFMKDWLRHRIKGHL